ncbi:CHAT domain-containing protein [Mycena vitilis]|nr:CHAT domain-containing protein [Mycena vitilis]
MKDDDATDIGDLWTMHEHILFLPFEHECRRQLLTQLGTLCLQQWVRTVSNIVEYLIQAVCVFEDAVRDDPADTACIGALGIALAYRFGQLNNVNDLHKAVMLLERALHSTAAHDPNRPVLLGYLGSSLLDRFKQLGSLSDLNESISMLETALQLAPVEDQPQQARWLQNLGLGLEIRFRQLGDLGNLQDSVNKQEAASCLVPNEHADRSAALSILGASLLTRFERLGNLCDLDDCISIQREAVKMTPEGSPERLDCIVNLALSLRARCKRLGNLDDLDECITMQQNIVQLLPNNDPGRPGSLNNLGGSLLIRSNNLSHLNDLNDAIDKLNDAVAGTPQGHPDKPARQENLGAWPANVRFSAASRWALGALMAQHQSVVEAHYTAIELLPEVAWLGLSIVDRHHQIKDAGPVVRNAATFAIKSRRPDMAVQWLEQGRSIIWGQLLKLRTPVDGLKQNYPELATELSELSAQLEGATTRTNDSLLQHPKTYQPPISIAQCSHATAQKRKLLLEKIRELEGFQNFLLPNTLDDLSLITQKGSIILVNAGILGCDALALRLDSKSKVLHVPLPMLTPGHRLLPYMGRANNMDRLHAHRERGSPSLEDDFARILSELWIHLVRPVLDGLAITTMILRMLQTPTTQPTERIWWCPTGALTLFPIHAAGLYGNNESFGSKLSDFVISSYTPSVAALIRGFTRTSCSPAEDFQLLAVAQPSAAGQSYIPGTANEIRRIQQCAGGAIPVISLIRDGATVARVEEEMLKSPWVHFACHGVQDATAPTESALLLAGNSRMMLSRIIQLNLPNADFAFLSACQTATGDRNLQEEAIHLAAGMLLAGYRGVIATMWSIMDHDAPEVAEDVYTHLFKTSPPDSTRAAEALHIAVQNLRERVDSEGKRKSLFHWVPFIHVGV